MAQEDKELLLKDLCARLPYTVICQFIWTYSNETTDGEEVIAIHDDNIKCINTNTKEIQADYYDEWVDLEHCKPYLRPISSMTEEEKKEFFQLMGNGTDIKRVDFYISHHFDYRGLIEKGLAIKALKGMYE